MATKEDIERAMWAGDVDTLHDIAGCQCCCDEHTFYQCPARQWFGCRGQFAEDHDAESWFKFYAASRGWTREQFFGD
jgi:hypothetical protein